MALYAGLPATGDMVQFGDDGDTTELRSFVRQWIAKYMEAK